MGTNHIACPLCKGVIPESPWPADQCVRCHGDLAIDPRTQPTDQGLRLLMTDIINGMKVSNEDECTTGRQAIPT